MKQQIAGTEVVSKAINASASALILRDAAKSENWQAPLPVPPEIAEFFRRVEGGILFPVPSPHDNMPNGFEVLDSTLFFSINQLLGDPLTASREPDCFDSCHVLFSAVADQCLLFGVDLSAQHYGWMFAVDLNPGNNPDDTAVYQARSFDSWLDWNATMWSQKQGERSTPCELPELGKVAAA